MLTYPTYDDRYRESVGRLLDGVLERLRPLVPLRGDDFSKGALLAMAIAALARLGSIRDLIVAGSLADAAILARSIIELDVSASYLFSAAPNERAELGRRFFAFEDVRRERLAKDLARLLTKHIESPTIETFRQMVLSKAAEDSQAARAEFSKIEKSDYWSGDSLKNTRDKISDPELKEAIEVVYDLGYRTLSDYAHPNPIGVRHALAIEFQYNLAGLLFTPLLGSMCTHHLCEMAATACETEKPASLDEVPGELLRILFGDIAVDPAGLERWVDDVLAAAGGSNPASESS